MLNAGRKEYFHPGEGAWSVNDEQVQERLVHSTLIQVNTRFLVPKLKVALPGRIIIH